MKTIYILRSSASHYNIIDPINNNMRLSARERSGNSHARAVTLIIFLLKLCTKVASDNTQTYCYLPENMLMFNMVDIAKELDP